MIQPNNKLLFNFKLSNSQVKLRILYQITKPIRYFKTLSSDKKTKK